MSNKKILIVEDEFPLLKALKEKLQTSGYNVLLAKNGQEGLDQALTKSPDLILLDILMPVMDGVTMLKKLRESKEGKNIPVIILTNLSDENKMRTAKDEEVRDYLIKSNYSLNDLLKKIKEKIK